MIDHLGWDIVRTDVGDVMVPSPSAPRLPGDRDERIWTTEERKALTLVAEKLWRAGASPMFVFGGMGQVESRAKKDWPKMYHVEE